MGRMKELGMEQEEAAWEAENNVRSGGPDNPQYRKAINESVKAAEKNGSVDVGDFIDQMEKRWPSKVQAAISWKDTPHVSPFTITALGNDENGLSKRTYGGLGRALNSFICDCDGNAVRFEDGAGTVWFIQSKERAEQHEGREGGLNHPDYAGIMELERRYQAEGGTMGDNDGCVGGQAEWLAGKRGR